MPYNVHKSIMIIEIIQDLVALSLKLDLAYPDS